MPDNEVAVPTRGNWIATSFVALATILLLKELVSIHSHYAVLFCISDIESSVSSGFERIHNPADLEILMAYQCPSPRESMVVWVVALEASPSHQ